MMMHLSAKRKLLQFAHKKKIIKAENQPNLYENTQTKKRWKQQ